MALLPLKKNHSTPRRRFDDQRSPKLLNDILEAGTGPRHYMVVQLGNAVQFRWDAKEPEAMAIGLPAEMIPTIPRTVVRDLPPDWVVRDIQREIDGDARRTVIRLGRPEVAAALPLAA